MKASTYVRRHTGEMPDAILKTLMTYHGCIHHNGPNSGACLADFKRTDLLMDTILPLIAKTDLDSTLPDSEEGSAVWGDIEFEDESDR